MDKSDKVIENLGTAIMCVNNMLTQEQFIVRDKVVNAIIEAINLIEEQKQQIEEKETIIMKYENCEAYKIKQPVDGICMGGGDKCKNCPAYIRYLEVLKEENDKH